MGMFMLGVTESLKETLAHAVVLPGLKMPF